MDLGSHTFEVERPVAAEGASTDFDVLILCEHASNTIPNGLNNLGLTKDILESHIAWDPGALGIAKALVRPLNGRLIYSTVSRLVYDCNRPPEAASAMQSESEIYHVPGNFNLTEYQQSERVQKIYDPFRRAVISCLSGRITTSYIATIHTFTPVFNGLYRDVEIGIFILLCVHNQRYSST